MPIAERIEPLTPEETAMVREVLAEWPKFKAAKESLISWITGVLARNPKLSNAITGLLTLLAGAATVWFTKPDPPPEKVIVPVEVRPAQKPEPKVDEAELPPAPGTRIKKSE